MKEEPSDKFIRKYTHDDGVIATWKFDLKKNPHGPYEVELDYPKNYKFKEEIENKINLNKNKTEQKYYNPNNGKYVGYSRAKTLGLIK